MRCPYCGKETKPGYEICPHCGYSLKPSPYDEETQVYSGDMNSVSSDMDTVLSSENIMNSQSRTYGSSYGNQDWTSGSSDDDGECKTTILRPQHPGSGQGNQNQTWTGNSWNDDYDRTQYMTNDYRSQSQYQNQGQNQNSYQNQFQNQNQNQGYQDPSQPDHYDDPDIYNTIPVSESGGSWQNSNYQSTSPNSGSSSKKKKGGKMAVLLLVGALAIAALGGGAWFGLNHFGILGRDSRSSKGSNFTYVDDSNYITATHEFINYSDFYNGYALVTYFRSNGSSNKQASLINEKGQLCPIKEDGRVLNGIEVKNGLDIYPIVGGGLMLFNIYPDIQNSRLLLIDQERNMVCLNDKGYSLLDFTASGDGCILMAARTADRTGIRSFDLFNLKGELEQSFTIKGELQNAPWKSLTTNALGSKYFVLKSGTGNNYLISKDTSRLFNSKEEDFPDATAEDKLLGILDCYSIKKDTYKTIILTDSGEIKQVIGDQDISNAGAVYNGSFFIPSDSADFTKGSVAQLSNGKFKIQKLNFTDLTETQSPKPVLCGWSENKLYMSVYLQKDSPSASVWSTYSFDLNGKQSESVIAGCLTTSNTSKQREVYYLNENPSYGLNFYEENEPVVIQNADTFTFYSENGSKSLRLLQ